MPFPTKYSSMDVHHCDDGDMTLFNGLLCAAGDSRGCDGARLAQGKDGRWWRSPRRIGWTWPNYDVSFSPDQALGVMLYVAASKDLSAFDRWVDWMADNRPCIIQLGSRCIQKGWLRYCSDDVPDKRCTFRPDDCTYLQATGIYLGSKQADLCDKVLDELGSTVAPFPKSAILPVPAQVLASATVNTPGFPLHLAGVALLLARTMELKNSNFDSAGQMLASRQDQNPFFQYLAQGATPGVTSLILSLCPAPGHPSAGNRNQWAWERDQNDHAWKDTMYWDCIFIGKKQ